MASIDALCEAVSLLEASIGGVKKQPSNQVLGHGGGGGGPPLVTIDQPAQFAARSTLSRAVGACCMTDEPITGTVRVIAGRLLFIECDDGACPNIFLHKAVAQRGGFTPPYEGRRVRCEIAQDGMGNCTATKVTEQKLK